MIKFLESKTNIGRYQEAKYHNGSKLKLLVELWNIGGLTDNELNKFKMQELRG